jgi:hypothetical protein
MRWSVLGGRSRRCRGSGGQEPQPPILGRAGQALRELGRRGPPQLGEFEVAVAQLARREPEGRPRRARAEAHAHGPDVRRDVGEDVPGRRAGHHEALAAHPHDVGAAVRKHAVDLPRGSAGVGPHAPRVRGELACGAPLEVGEGSAALGLIRWWRGRAADHGSPPARARAPQ